MDPQTAQANSCGDPTRMELDRIDRHRSTTQSRSAADLFITLAGALGGSRDYAAASAVSLPASEYSEQDLSHLRKPNSTSHARLLVEPGVWTVEMLLPRPKSCFCIALLRDILTPV
jgi:hypothetical protein